MLNRSAKTFWDGRLASVVGVTPCNLARGSEDEVCYDDPAWTDSLGRSCKDWTANPSWCTGSVEDGTYDPPSTYAVFGKDATTACCVCKSLTSISSCPEIPISAFHGAQIFFDTLDPTTNSSVHQWGLNVGSAGETGRIKSKIAQVRVYPGRLTSKQLLHIQRTSRWDRPADPPAPKGRLEMYVRAGLPRFHCYGWEDAKKYDDAVSACRDKGQTLAKIEPGQEHVLLNSCPPGEYFIGADDQEVEGEWKWILDGTTLSLESSIWRKDGDEYEPNVRICLLCEGCSFYEFLE